MIDTSIYQNLLRPPKSVAEYDAEAVQGQTNRLALRMGQQKADEYTRGLADQANLRDVVKGFGSDPTENGNLLLKAGRLKEAQDYAKTTAEAAAKTADVGKTKAETGKIDFERVSHQFEIAGQLAGAWANNPAIKRDDVLRGLAAAHNSGVLDDKTFQSKSAEVAGLPDDPKALNGWAQGTLQQVMKAKDSVALYQADANTVLTAKTSRDNNRDTNATSRDNNRDTTAASRYATNSTATTAANRLKFDKDQATAENAPDTTTDDEKKLWLHQYVANNGQVPRSAPPSVRKNIGTWAAQMGITPNDLSTGAAQTKFDMAAAGTSGHRAGGMASVEATMPALTANAMDLSKKLDQGKFVPLNQLVQMADDKISDPNLAAFKVAHMAVVSEYQQVIGRGGTNVTALKEAMHVLNSATSPQAYTAALNQVNKEVAINVAGTKAVRAGLGGAGHAPAAATSSVIDFGSLK